jgi:hypothetical protein
MASVVLGIFSQTDNASEAINSLEAEGYNPKDMSILMKDRQDAQRFAKDTGAGDVVGGAVGGATTGAILGGLAGLLAAFVVPGLGAFFIGGPIASALGLGGAAASAASGAVTGAAAGGLLGALTSAFDLSDEDARIYEERINEGGILVAVPARSGEEAQVISILEEFGADNIKRVNSTETKMGSRRSEESRGGYASAHFSEVGRGRRGVTRKG